MASPSKKSADFCPFFGSFSRISEILRFSTLLFILFREISADFLTSSMGTMSESWPQIRRISHLPESIKKYTFLYFFPRRFSGFFMPIFYLVVYNNRAKKSRNLIPKRYTFLESAVFGLFLPQNHSVYLVISIYLNVFMVSQSLRFHQYPP